MGRFAPLIISILLFLAVLAAIIGFATDPTKQLQGIIDEHATTALIFLAGAVGTWLTKEMFRSARSHDTSDQVEAQQETAQAQKTVPWSKYRQLSDDRKRIVRMHNALAARLREVLDAHKTFDKDAREQQQRVYLGQRVVRTAVVFSILSLIITVFAPPPSSGNGSPVTHVVGLAAACAITSGYYAFMVSRRTRFSRMKTALSTGLAGIALSGFISLAVSLPYLWNQMEGEHRAAFEVPLGPFIVAFRLGLLPLIGFVAAGLIQLLSRRRQATLHTK